MRRYSVVLAPLVLLGLIALGIFIFFKGGSDLALITIIFIFIPAMIGAAFMVRYLVTVRKGSLREKVMVRDVEGVANRYVEQMRILHDFEDKYGISTSEFRRELEKVKEGLAELGCEVNGRVRMDRVKQRSVVFADVEWVTKMFDGIKERHEVVLYSRMIERSRAYLDGLRALEDAGYDGIRGNIEQIESKIVEDENLKKDSLELSIFMNELDSRIEEALRTCLHDAHGLEAEGRETANADTARVRTDMKLVEHSIERGNYESASKVLNSVIGRLSRMLADVFEQYKTDTLALTAVVVDMLGKEEEEVEVAVVDREKDKNMNKNKKEIEALREHIEKCMTPSEMRKLRAYGDALILKAITALEATYNKIFTIEEQILRENPATELYPVEYWTRDKIGEIEELRSMPKSEVSDFVRRYRLLASDAISRLVYDSESLRRLSRKQQA
ncbi:MAG: hypothetical protein WAV32_00625 [Halobacteriota archaeon]